MNILQRFGLLCLVCLITASSIFSGELTGRVMNSETNNLIRGVNVTIIELNKTVESDKRGIYQFKNIPENKYTVVASHVGFDKADTIEVTVSGMTSIDIKLKPSPWVLNDVVITGTRTPHLLKDVPVQTEVISERDFARTGAKSVDEALSSAIGININEDLSGQAANIRGIEGDRVLILVDGERAVGRVRGAIDLSQYSLNNVEKIEIIKGTGSTLYGSDAMGGVINIITKKPQETEAKADVYFDYGRYNQYNPSVDFEYGTSRNSVLVGTSYYATDGFDLDKTTLHTNGQEMIKRWNGTSKLKHQLTENMDLILSGRYMQEKREWIESEKRKLNAISDTVDVPFDDIEENKRYEGSLNMNYLSGDKYSMKMRLFATYYDHIWNKFAVSDGTWEDTSDTQDLFLEASYTSNYVIGENHIATYGFDYNYQDLTSTELISTKEADKSYATYLQYEYQLLKQLNTIIGTRYEHHSSYGGHFNPSFNLMYKPNEQLKFRGFVGKGFRAPSIKEQYFVFDHTSAGYIVYGGNAIDPATIGSDADFQEMQEENSINSSISAEFSYGTIGLHRITYFYNHLDNLIDFIWIDFDDGYWRGRYVYQNIEAAITQGIEWESRIRLNKSTDFSFSYNYLKTKDLSTGDELRNRPVHTLKFFLTWLSEKSGFGGSFYGDFASKKIWVPRSNTGGNENVDNEGNIITDNQYAPQRFRLNLNLFKRFDNGLEVFTRAENLLDKTNVDYGYWPGLTIFMGLKYDFSL